MSELLSNHINLDILENLCSGVGVDINISKLAKTFNRHRNTIKSQVNNLFQYKIINKPIYPLAWLYQEYPLMVIARAELPRNDSIVQWFKKDKHIFAVFYVRDEEYDTLLIEFHKDFHSYSKWKKNIRNETHNSIKDVRNPAHALIFSTRDMIKYQPHSPIFMMEDKFNKGELTELNGYKINTLNLQILKKLVTGECIRTNENLLARKLELHRRTVDRHITMLIENGIIGSPVCRFPRFFVPPNQIMVYYLMEIKRKKKEIHEAILLDPHISMALEAGIGNYNIVMFGVFASVEDHFIWEEKYDQKFKDSVGAMKKIYLSPRMAVPIDQQKVSLEIIKEKRSELKI